MFNIFQQPWALLITAVLVLFVLLMFRRIFPEKRHWWGTPAAKYRRWEPWQWLLPGLLAVAAFGLDFSVQTDIEKINAVINTGVKAVEEENCNAIEAIISDIYRDSYHNTKKALMNHCRAKLTQPLVEKNIKRIVSIEISPPKATATFTVRTVFDKQSYVYNFRRLMLVKMKLDLQRQLDSRWLINRAEILELDRQPVNWKHIEQLKQ